MKNYFQFGVSKSIIDRFEVKCVIDECRWGIRASNIDRNGKYWSVKRFEEVYICGSDQLQPDYYQASTQFISKYVMDKFQDFNKIYTPNNIRDDIHYECKVHVSYRKAGLVREETRRLACEEPIKSFKLLL